MANLSWEDRDDGRWILLAGELDHEGSRELGESLRSATACDSPVCVDMTEVTFIGSHALRLLLEANHHMAEAGHQLSVSGLRPIVRKVFETTGIFDAIPERPA